MDQQLGYKGYQKCMLEDWDGALAIWNEAIRRFPKEKKFYNNRAFSHLHRKDYKSALADASFLTINFPEYARGHFRKAEILGVMGRYREAEQHFRRVLSIEPACEDAGKEMKEMQIQQLLSLGFSRYQAGNALDLATGLEQAKAILRAGGIPDQDGDYYISDDDDDDDKNFIPGAYDPHQDPNNPRKCSSLWIGNVSVKMTDAELEKLFSRFGKVKSAKTSTGHYAFINYVDPESASKAMRELQGRDFAGNKNLKLRWTDKEMGK